MTKPIIPVLTLLLLAGCASLPPAGAPMAISANGCEQLVDPERSSFVMHEVVSGRTLVCNEDRAQHRFVAASTFKVAHALIALETGAVDDEAAPFPWDGRARGVAAWDRDTSLAGAMRPSTVWVFQAVASRIGSDREQAWLTRLSYGNAQAGGEARLRSFWLSGPLTISAFEQIAFLSGLRAGTLDASPRNQQRVRDMLHLRDCGPDCRVYGKTGAVLPIDDDGFLRNDAAGLLPAGERTGWFVGWVDRPADAGGPVIFAHNLDLGLPDAMAARTRAAYALLAANGVAVGGG